MVPDSGRLWMVSLAAAALLSGCSSGTPDGTA
jgi:hypothetical protein